MMDFPSRGVGGTFFGSLTRSIFFAGAFGGAMFLLVRQWSEIAQALGQLSPAPLMIALMLGLAHVVTSFMAWQVLLIGHDAKPTTGAMARMFFLGQIGKYLPGGIWSFVAVAEFGRESGLGRSTTMASQLLALVVSLGVALAIGIGTVPQAIDFFPSFTAGWIIAALPLAFMLLPGLRTFTTRLFGIDLKPSFGALLLSTGLTMIVWTIAGTQLVVLSQAVGANIGWDLLPAMTGAYAIAWAAGFVFVLAPAGLGAREVVLVALLSAYMPVSEAAVVAFLARISMTLADVLLAAITGFALRPQAAR